MRVIGWLVWLGLIATLAGCVMLTLLNVAHTLAKVVNIY